MRNGYYYYFHRLGFLLNILQRYGSLTREEISNLWLDDINSDGVPISTRTIQRSFTAIRELYGIDVVSRKCGKRRWEYYIKNPEDLNPKRLSGWSMAAFNMGDTLLRQKFLHDRILLEEFPSENGMLQPILQAMSMSRKLNISYQKYNSEVVLQHTVCPYCVKQYGKRLFLIAQNIKGSLLSFSLDRIVSLDILREKFRLPATFDAEEYFAYAYGVFVDDKDPDAVVLRAYGDEAWYIKDVPIHISQNIVSETAAYTDFSYIIVPTNDFIGYIVSRGKRLKVLSPQFLADEVRKRHTEAAALYD